MRCTLVSAQFCSPMCSTPIKLRYEPQLGGLLGRPHLGYKEVRHNVAKLLPVPDGVFWGFDAKQ